MHHAFRIGEGEHNVELSRGATAYHLHIGEAVHAVRLGDGVVVVDGVAAPIVIAQRGDDVYVHVDGAAYHLQYEHPLDRLAHQGHGAAEDGLRAPMPGSLVAVHVKPGAAVTKGQALLVMESMKMETTLTAGRDGIVAEVHVAPGQTFDRDALLLSLAPQGAVAGADAKE